MRTLPVVFKRRATDDLDGIFDYLLEQGASIPAARAFVGRIEAQCERIGRAPEGYPARPEFGEGVRIAPFEHSAVVIYRPTETVVDVLRVYYGGRNYQKLIRDTGMDED
jgi:toxin ParE1/3/4